jgi:hypothetical protein
MGITMLAKTGKAVAFRQWARKTLANLPKIQQTPQSQLPQDYIEALERLVCAEKDKLQLQNAVQTQKQEIQVLEYSKEVVEKNLEIKTAEVKEKDANVENKAQQKFFKQFRITKHGMAFLIKNRNEIIKK